MPSVVDICNEALDLLGAATITALTQNSKEARLCNRNYELVRDAVRVENMTGKNASFDQVGKATAQKRTTRHADTPQIDTPHARRRVSLVDYEYADLIDDQDKVRMLIDP